MADLIKPLQNDIVDIYKSLSEETTWLFGRWIVFCQLFWAKKENVDLLNEFAPSFFRMMQDTYIYYVIITICRITDPLKSLGKNNRTLSQLIDKLTSTDYEDIKNILQDKLLILTNECSEIRKWRNKKLVHSDLSISQNVEQLPALYYDKIKIVLEQIKSFMNEFEIYFYDCPVGYDYFMMQDDGDTILEYLRSLKNCNEHQ